MAERLRAEKLVKNKFNTDNIEILDSFFEGAPHDANSLWLLGKSIQIHSQAAVAYFIGNWRNYCGCKSENYIAKAYGVATLEE